MIDLLERAEAFIEVALALCVGPQYVPIVSICLHQTIDFKNEADQFRLTLEHLVVDRIGKFLATKGVYRCLGLAGVTC